MHRSRILLIIGGGIAAYKSLELIRLLRDRGAEVKAVITRAGEKFVTPLSVAALSGSHTSGDLFDHSSEAEFSHIELARWADLILIAPATADFIARMAHGHANDLATALILASDSKIACAPAMNVAMWHKPTTQRNVAIIRDDGAVLIGPEEGDMACGEFGFGRMSEPVAICAAVEATLGHDRNCGLHAVITSGPTRESIDPVRYVSNRSSGKQGRSIADALERRGVRVTFVTGPAEVPNPPGPKIVKVESADEMKAAVLSALPADVVICAAAVSDWRASSYSGNKLKKEAGVDQLTVELVRNPDILATVARLEKGRPRLVVGFAAETENLLDNARKKLKSKGCDWIVANNVAPGSDVMGGDTNQVTVLTGRSEEVWEKMSKAKTADRLCDRIIAYLQNDQSQDQMG